MTNKNGVMFLFGAGAEHYFDMPLGSEFAKLLLLPKEKNDLDRIYTDKVDSRPLISSKSVTVYAQTIVEHEKKIENDWVTKYEVTREELINLAKTVINKDYDSPEWKNTNKAKWDTFLKNFKDDLKKSIHTDEVDTAALSWRFAKFMLENAKFCETLDSKFNGLRISDTENLLNKRAQRVVYAYCNIHYALAKAMGGKEHNIEGFNGNDFLNFLGDYSHKYFSKCDNNPENYYNMIQQIRGNNIFYYATTNYTPFSECCLGKGNVIYLNGKMTWFEDYINLQMYDIENPSERKSILEGEKIRSGVFPFIFLQSGVKPIVLPKQICEIYNFYTRLKDCNKLIVLGYNLNNDDNHINAIIIDWLCTPNHKMIYCEHSEKEPMFKNYKWYQKVEKNIEIKNDIFKFFNNPRDNNTHGLMEIFESYVSSEI